MKKFRNILIVVIVLAVLIGLGNGMVVTRENEYTLIRQFGKVSYVIDEPGLSFKIPFIQSADKLPKELLLYDLAGSDVITKDKKTMITDSYVLWQIVDPLKFAQTLNSSIGAAENRIDAVVYNAIKNAVSNMNQTDIINGRDTLTNNVEEGIGSSMAGYGIELVSVETKRLDLPADNKQAVYERMISERDQIAAEYTADGNSQAQVIRNTTDREVAITLSNAQAEAATIIAEGESQYMQILADAFNNAEKQEFYSFIRSLEAAKNSLSGGNKTLILDKESPIAQIFYQK